MEFVPAFFLALLALCIIAALYFFLRGADERRIDRQLDELLDAPVDEVDVADVVREMADDYDAEARARSIPVRKPIEERRMESRPRRKGNLE